MSDQQHPLEQEVTQRLTEGDMELIDPEEGARNRLTPRYEIRIQAKHDPIVEETNRYRKLAQEIDQRYDKYAEHNTKQDSCTNND